MKCEEVKDCKKTVTILFYYFKKEYLYYCPTVLCVCLNGGGENTINNLTDNLIIKSNINRLFYFILFFIFLHSVQNIYKLNSFIQFTKVEEEPHYIAYVNEENSWLL